MKLIGIAMVKNEADIIETFVRHNLGLLDRLLIIDHQSSDATVPILNALRAEGLQVDLMRDTAIAFRQGDRMTELALQAFSQHHADHVFTLDADEFILAESRAQLEGVLAQLPDGAHASLPWSNRVPEDAPPESLHPFARIRLAASADVSPMTKLVLGKSLPASRLVISHGNHALLKAESDTWQMQALPGIVDGIALAHLPFRSTEQFVGKIVLSWFGNRLLQGSAARFSETNRHWRELFDCYLAGETPNWKQMREHALRCYLLAPDARGQQLPLSSVRICLDPLPVRFELKHTSATASDPMRRLSVWVEQLLDRQM